LYPSDEFAQFGTYCSLPELLQRSDIISLHAPLNKNTLHLIGPVQIANMKRSAFIINCSRGGLVDTRAVIDGLASGAVGALGMDVYEREGRIFFKDFSAMNRSKRMRDWDEQMAVLLSLPNVLITPHSAFLTTEALANIASTTVDNITAFVRGEVRSPLGFNNALGTSSLAKRSCFVAHVVFSLAQELKNEVRPQ
jgi:D-lactate dehydrogenase